METKLNINAIEDGSIPLSKLESTSTNKSLVFDVDNIEPIYSIEESRFFSLEQLESNIGSTIDKILEFSRNDMIDLRCDGMLFKSTCGSTYDENTDAIYLFYSMPGLDVFYTLNIFKEPIEVNSGIYACATLSTVPLSSNIVDDEMSDTSENGVQNKVVKSYVDTSIAQAITTTINANY